MFRLFNSNKLIWSINNGDKQITMLSLILPMLLKSIFEQLCGNINTIVLSGYSAIAINASGVANEIFNIGNIIIGMVSTGTVIIIAIKIGENKLKEVRNITGTGTIFVLVFSLIVALIEFFCAELLMSIMNLSGETLKLAVDYCHIYALFIPILSISSYLSSVIICNGYPKYTLIVGSISSILNLIAAYVAIYPPFNFMTPITRVALFSGIVSFFTCGMNVFVFIKIKIPFRLKFVTQYAVKIFTLGSAGVMSSFIWRASQSFTTSLIADRGDVILNTKIYISNIIVYVPLISYAISSSNSVFMGRLKGLRAIDKQKRLYRQNTLFASMANLIFSLTSLFLHRPLMRIFTDNEAIINASVIIFILDIFVEIPRAINNISESSFNANGDVKTTFITSTISCLFGSVVLAYVFCNVLDLGLVGIWFSFIAAELFKSITYILRWKMGKWSKTSV